MNLFSIYRVLGTKVLSIFVICCVAYTVASLIFSFSLSIVRDEPYIEMFYDECFGLRLASRTWLLDDVTNSTAQAARIVTRMRNWLFFSTVKVWSQQESISNYYKLFLVVDSLIFVEPFLLFETFYNIKDFPSKSADELRTISEVLYDGGAFHSGFSVGRHLHYFQRWTAFLWCRRPVI